MLKQSFDKQKFTLIETLVVSVCLFLLLGSVIFGIYNQSKVNQDKIKIRNLMSIAKALEQYYNDSSSSEYSRKYPISQCSTTEPNHTDFEHTLYINLSGVIPNSFKYVEPVSYPQDPNAKFQPLGEDKCNNLLQSFDRQKYSINNQECNYVPEKGINNCYMYSTSPEGDRYTLAFYSESRGKLIKISRLQANIIKADGIDLLNESVE